MAEVKVFIAGVESSLWTRLRVYALQRGKPVKTILRDAIEEFLMRHEAKA